LIGSHSPPLWSPPPVLHWSNEYFVPPPQYEGFSGELCFTFAGIVRFALPFSIAFRRDVCTRPRGSCASGPSSSLMTAPVCLFPCHHRSGSGRSSFNVLGMSWMAHGVNCCSDSKAWSCSSVLAIGFLPVSSFATSLAQFGGVVGGGGLR
jgi:hypothetical protein